MNRLILETPSTTRQTDVRTRNAAVLVFALEFIFSQCANRNLASGLYRLDLGCNDYLGDVLPNESSAMHFTVKQERLLKTPLSVDFRSVELQLI